MDFLTTTVTLISLGLALSMGIISWRLVREERRRSDATIAALQAKLTRFTHSRAGSDEVASVSRPRPTRKDDPGDEFEPARGYFLARTESAESFLEGHDLASAAVASGQPATRRLTTTWLACAAAVAVGLAVVAFTQFRGEPKAVPSTEAALPLELLSLTHTRQGGYLVIRGTLRNPPDGREWEQLSAAATLFDTNGTVIGTGETPLAADVLSRGAQTAFSISLPDTEHVSRYRVSFSQDQSNVPHIDQRGAREQAHSTEPTAPEALP